MTADGFQLTRAALPPLFIHRWLPDTPPRAVLLIVHGMAEHGARYARFAAAANAQGFAVFAPDLPGHGLSAKTEDRGFVADDDSGWAQMVDAIDATRVYAARSHPGLPIVAFGHSMGSFLMQDYLVEHGAKLAAAVLSATSHTLGPLRALGRLLMQAEGALLGRRHPSALAEALTFKAFNKPFAPARTGFDWLSRDPAEVDAYVADPLCGFRCSAQMWADLFAAGAGFGDAARLARIPKSLPILLICGTADPVSQGRTGPDGLVQRYRAAGIADASVIAYADGRHELLNDVCREQTTADVLGWMVQRLG